MAQPQNRMEKNVTSKQESSNPPSDGFAVANIKNPASVIDVIGHDTKSDEVVLVMNATQTWDGSDAQLHDLQERFNTYASFLLDGEFAESHPELANRKARIEVRCDHMPDARALGLLGLIHDQLAFQEIQMEVIIAGEEGCGSGCTCH